MSNYDAMSKIEEHKNEKHVVQSMSNLNINPDRIQFQAMYHSLGIKDGKEGCKVY